MPAYSIGKSRKQPSFVPKNDNPGIGSYATQGWIKQSRQKSSSAASMTRAARLGNSLNSSLEKVGPGSYNPEKPFTSLKPSIKSRHPAKMKTQAPSPAQYNPKVNYGCKQYSFGNSRRRLVTKDGPSPNTYQIPSQMNKTGGIISKQERSKKSREISPGPGQYGYQSAGALKKGEFSFTHEKKFLADQMVSKEKILKPGPATYNLSQFKKNIRGGKFYQTSRQCIQIQKGKPGPGQYNNASQFISKKNPRTVFGTQQRSKDKNIDIPGPGNYNSVPSQITKKNYGKTVFPKGEKDQVKSFQFPGPGAYETALKNDSKYVSISARNFFSKEEKSPGPQDYNPEIKYIIAKSGETKFGKEQKSKRIRTEAPGPGAYKQSEKKFSKTFFFNRAKKNENLHSSTVGPGQYKLKPYFGQYDGLKKDEKEILFV